MRYFLVSYAYGKGFGRRLFGVNGPVDEATIRRWEASCGEAANAENTVVIAISQIDGPVTSAEEPNDAP